jgi:protein kinase C substrate 80K-H
LIKNQILAIIRVRLYQINLQKHRLNKRIHSLCSHWHQWNDGGDNENRYSRQHYNKGQSCWNGPERTTEVVIECGTETKLVDASEPGRCEYRFVLETPAACPDPSTLHEQHEEL